MSKQLGIAKNTTYLTGAFVLQKVLSFVYFTLIAIALGASATGAYVFALSYTTLFAVFIDFGLTQVLIRDIAQDPSKKQSLLSSILGIKFWLSIIVVLVVVISSNFIQKPLDTKIMIWIASVIIVGDALNLSIWGVLRGMQNLSYEAVATVLNQIITLVFGGIVLFFHLPVYLLVAALLIGTVFNLSYGIYTLRKKLNISLRLDFDKATALKLLKIAFPFALLGIFMRLYSQVDQILLSFLSGDTVLGWYSVPYKITFALQFIPASFAAALYPALSAYYKKDKEKFKNIFEQSLKYMAIVAFPVSFGIAALAPEIILNIYTEEYTNSILPLQIMIFSIIFVFINFPVGALLNAAHKQVLNTWMMGIVMVVNICANIILIPMLSHVGASIAVMLSSIILFILGMYWSYSVSPFSLRSFLINIAKLFVASLVMFVTVMWLKSYIHYLLTIPVGAIIFVGSIYILHIFDRDEINQFLGYLPKKKSV